MKEEKHAPFTQKIPFSDEDFKIYVKEQAPPTERSALHEDIEIKYFYGDPSALMINSEVFIARAGDIAIVNPYEIHTTVNIEEYSGRYYLIMVSLDFLNRASGGLDLRNIFLVQQKKIKNLIRDDRRLQTIILRIAEEVERKEEHYRLVVKNLVSEFFALLLRTYLQEGDREGQAEGARKHVELIAPALERIHTAYMTKLSIDELSALCSMSRYHFCRTFKRAMGVTAIEYLTAYRVDLAEAMLKDASDSIREIAPRCGFEDESYFYRCYKRLKGVSPKSVRRREE